MPAAKDNIFFVYKKPRHILLIGVGWTFMAGEILKPPVVSLDIAVEDEKFTVSAWI